MTPDELNLRTMGALLDLALGSESESGRSVSDTLTDPAGVLSTAQSHGQCQTPTSTEVVKTSEQRLRLMQPLEA